MYDFYGTFNLYDYLTLWLNDINDISNEENFNRKIILYGKSDLDKWYVDNMRDE